MELRDYLAALRRRWLTLATAVLLGGGAAVVATVTTTPTYTASTQTFVSVQSGVSTGELAQGASFSQQQVASYVLLVTSQSVLGPVIDELGLPGSAQSLAPHVSATSPDKTSLVDITVSDASPALAAALADAVTAQFADVIDELERRTDGSPAPVRLTTVRSASVPTQPSSPDLTLNLTLGVLLGLVVGVGVAALREVLDTKVKDETDLAKATSASIVGTIGFDEDAARKPLIVQSDPHSPRAEAFRRLRTNVQFLDVADRPHSIIVTSSLPGEGKSTTAINLAIALADSGTRVALVDADLRRPSIAEYMGVEGRAGLTTVLIGQATLDDVVQPWGNGFLDVLASGQVPPNPSELLGSRAMADLLAELNARYDLVIIDCPPLLPVTDAAVLSKVTGGALVVVGAGEVHRNQVAETMRALDTVGARVLGVVLNRQQRTSRQAYDYYRYDAPRESVAAPRTATPADDVPVAAGVGPAAHTWPGEPLTTPSTGTDRPAPPPQHMR